MRTYATVVTVALVAAVTWSLFLTRQNVALRAALERTRVESTAGAAAKRTSQPAPATASPRGHPATPANPSGIVYGVIKHRDLSLDPMLPEFFVTNLRRSVLNDYGEAFVRMHLDRATAERVVGVMMDAAIATQAAVDRLKEQGVDDAEVLSASSRETEKRERAFIEILGQAGLNQLYTERRLAGERRQLSTGLAAEMNLAGAPLSPDQLEQLAKVYLASRPREDRAELSSRPGAASGLGPKQQARLDGASQFLTPEQLAVLRKFELEQTRIDWFWSDERAAN